MGTWAVDTFGNDTACDWAGQFARAGTLEDVPLKLAEVLSSGDYLDADIATEALAACEVLARLQGRWGLRNAYSQDLDAWVLSHPIQPSADLIRKAVLAIDRILAEQSELAELWKDSPEGGAWRTSVEDLRRRVSGTGG